MDEGQPEEEDELSEPVERNGMEGWKSKGVIRGMFREVFYRGFIR